eukprot:XP_001706395.1 Hypothetical protein GL50803_34886 [Giardia lamblia ATCC 50803]
MRAYGHNMVKILRDVINREHGPPDHLAYPYTHVRPLPHKPL